MHCGLHFIFANGEALQTVIDTASLNVFARATAGGSFGPWQLLCGPGLAGSGESGGGDVSHADFADRATAFAAPITITFTGAVTGEATFDGSQNVSAALSLTGDSGGGTSEDRVRELVREVIKEELGNGRPPYKLIEQSIETAFRAHQLEWHNGIQ